MARPTPPPGVSFHKYALGSTLEALTNEQFKSLPQLYDICKARGIIDILKMDIEGSEYAALLEQEVLQFLRHNVRQLLIEVHFQTARRAVELAEALRDAGFRTFSVEPNVIGCLNGECVEFSLLNINLLEPHDNQ